MDFIARILPPRSMMHACNDVEVKLYKPSVVVAVVLSLSLSLDSLGDSLFSFAVLIVAHTNVETHQQTHFQLTSNFIFTALTS